MAENIPLIFTAEITELRKKLESVKGMTKKEARAATAELTKAFKSAAKDIEKGGLKKVVDGIGDDASKLAQGFGVISGSAQGLATTVADLADGLTGVLSVGGPAGAALVGIGVAGAGVAVVGAAVVGVVEGLVQLTNYADDAAAGVRRLGASAGVELVDPAAFAAVERAADAMDALGVAADAVIIQFASQFAPTVEDTSVLLLATVLAVGDLVDGSTVLIDTSVQVGAALIDNWFQPVELIVNAIGGLVKTAAGLADVVGADELAAGLNAGADAMMNFDVGTMLVDGAGMAVGGLRDAVSSYLPEAQALIDAQTRINNGMKQSIDMAKGYADSLRGMAEDSAAARDAEGALAALVGMERAELEKNETAIGRVEIARADALAAALGTYQAGVAAAAGNDQQMLALQEQFEITKQAIVTQSEGEILSIRSAAAQAELDRKAGELEAFRANAIAKADSWMGGVADLSAAMADTIGASNAAAGEKMWKFSQLAAVGQVAFQTGIAIMKAYADLGPIAGSAAAAGLAVVGLTQALAIKNQDPPSFATGGVFSGGTTGGMDHQVFSMSPREAATGVLTPRGVDALGGPRGVGAANRGQGGGPTVVMNALGGRLEDRVTRHRITGPGSLSRAFDELAGSKGRHRG